MRRFVLAGNVDGRLEMLPKLRAVVRERRPEALLVAGGILADSAPPAPEKRKRWEEFLQFMGELGVFTAVVPGAAETPLREFLILAKECEIAHPNLHVAHATLFEEKDMAVCGLGGELTETEDCTEDRLQFSRATTEYFLRSLWRSRQPVKVLLLSVPPPGPLGGAAGNSICGDLIDTYHPSLCLVAGTTPRRGVQRIAHTVVVNPGRLADGAAASFDRTRSADQQVEWIQV